MTSNQHKVMPSGRRMASKQAHQTRRNLCIKNKSCHGRQVIPASEYKNLRQAVPSLKLQRDVSKVEVVTEAARYIDHLHKTLIERFIACGIPDSLKDFIGTDDARELNSNHIMRLVSKMAAAGSGSDSDSGSSQHDQDNQDSNRGQLEGDDSSVLAANTNSSTNSLEQAHRHQHQHQNQHQNQQHLATAAHRRPRVPFSKRWRSTSKPINSFLAPHNQNQHQQQHLHLHNHHNHHHLHQHLQQHNLNRSIPHLNQNRTHHRQLPLSIRRFNRDAHAHDDHEHDDKLVHRDHARQCS